MPCPPPSRSSPRPRERLATAPGKDPEAPVDEDCVPTAPTSNARRSSSFRRATPSRKRMACVRLSSAGSTSTSRSISPERRS
uniref:Uncharacterized protein n=1 Tax=Arundo donax TaxID=35708 RepID=A0A0A9C432_ARUDO